MEDIFSSPNWYPMRSRYGDHDGGSSIPVRSPQTSVHQQKSQPRTAPKIVQIPVRFVGEEKSRSDYALIIQKVFQGYLVRSRLKKILQLRREVDEIEERISSIDAIEVIRVDPKERLRINEMLMSLLFRLDSVSSVDAGVRDWRKAVIKKVIAMQEVIDEIATSSNQIQPEAPVESPRDVPNCGNCHPENCSDEDKLARDIDVEAPVDKINFEKPSEQGWSKEETVGNCGGGDETSKLEVRPGKEENDESGEDVDDSWVTINMEADDGKETGEICDMTSAVSECMEQKVGMCPMESVEVNEASEKTVKENGEERKEGGADNMMNNHQLLQRLMEDNQKMMNMMEQLSERNEMQTQMLNVLRNKVEQLEKAFICDRLRRKKKRHNP